MHETVAMLKALLESLEFDHHVRRIYTPSVAPPNELAIEWEFESLEQYSKIWADWSDSPLSAEFMERWWELTESGGTNELWNLET
jgi:hypothetical protein